MEQSPLPRSKRFITTHNEEGKAIFSEKVSPEVKWGNIGKAQFFLGYATKNFPSKLNDEEDITTGWFRKHNWGAYRRGAQFGYPRVGTLMIHLNCD
jgi:hypothetical protein